VDEGDPEPVGVEDGELTPPWGAVRVFPTASGVQATAADHSSRSDEARTIHLPASARRPIPV
jgi:hypothetical protein